jgi:predicted RNA binding protein YcfA (HicA-like mRNA interferase family)
MPEDGERSMGTALPVVSGRETVKALERLGFVIARQGKGDHIVLWKSELRRPVVVPDHRELDRGTLRAIIRQAGVSVEEFVAAL